MGGESHERSKKIIRATAPGDRLEPSGIHRGAVAMKILELFAGTRSIGKAFEAHGHEVFSVEWDKNFENPMIEEIVSLDIEHYS